MSNPLRFPLIALAAASMLGGSVACGQDPQPGPQQVQQQPPQQAPQPVPQPVPIHRAKMAVTATDEQVTAQFESRMKNYLDLHRRLENSLPKLPKEATPEQLDKNQRELGQLIKAERAGAKQGEFFSPGMQALVKRTMDGVMSGPDGKTIKASIMDENPGVPNLSVNDRYPDAIPLSTMPPQVLDHLPKLDEDIEYRFIGKRLALIDAHAHIIIDFTDNVLP